MILNEKNQVLLGHRHKDPAKADSELHGEDTWTMPGGKLDWQETPMTGARREVQEETGLEVVELKFLTVTNDRVNDNHFITVAFLCQDFIGEPKVMEPDEITEWQWFDLDELPKKIFLSSKKILGNYLAKKYYSDD